MVLGFLNGLLKISRIYMIEEGLEELADGSPKS